MIHTIYKYLVHPGEFEIDLPEGSQVLTVQEQAGDAFMWVLQDIDKPKVTRLFFSVPTGRVLDPAGLSYINTFQLGNLVFHVFERMQAQSAAPD